MVDRISLGKDVYYGCLELNWNAVGEVLEKSCVKLLIVICQQLKYCGWFFRILKFSLVVHLK